MSRHKGRMQGTLSQHGVPAVEGRRDNTQTRPLALGNSPTSTRLRVGTSGSSQKPPLIPQNWASWTTLMCRIHTSLGNYIGALSDRFATSAFYSAYCSDDARIGPGT